MTASFSTSIGISLVLSLLLSARLTRAEPCAKLQSLRDNALVLCQTRKVDAPVLTKWTHEAGAAVSECAVRKQVDDFQRDPCIVALLGRRPTGKKTEQEGKDAGEGSTPASAGKEDQEKATSVGNKGQPGSSSGRPLSVENPKVYVTVVGSEVDLFALAREKAITMVRLAVASCESVSKCPGIQRQATIDAVREYMLRVLASRTSSVAIEEFADSMLVLGSPLLGLPQEQLESTLKLAGELSSLDISDFDPSDLPEGAREILQMPPSATRTRKIFELLLEQSRSAKDKDKADETRLSTVAETAAAMRELEVRMKAGRLRTMLLDVASLPERTDQACELRSRVEQSAVTRLTRKAGIPHLKRQRNDCQGDTCDVELRFSLVPCASVQLSGSNGCLHLGVAMADNATTAGASLPVQGNCPDQHLTNDVIDAALRELRAVLRLRDVVQTTAVPVPKDAVRVLPYKTFREIPEQLVGTGIELVPPQNEAENFPGLMEDLQASFAEMGYRGTGTVRPSAPFSRVHLTWRRTSDALKVELWYRTETGTREPLFEETIAGNKLVELPAYLAAQRIANNIVNYYERVKRTSSPVTTPFKTSRTLLLPGAEWWTDDDDYRVAGGIAWSTLDVGLLGGGVLLVGLSIRERNNYAMRSGSLDRASDMERAGFGLLGAFLVERIVWGLVGPKKSSH